MERIVCVDIEATGLNTKLDKIIEIGAVEIKDGTILESFSTFVNPGRKLADHITEITKITDADLVNAPYIEEVLPSLYDFLSDSVLLGHNLSMDYAYLKHAFINAGYEFERSGLDTLKIARAMHHDLQSKKLFDLCAYYNIDLIPHRAINDAYATATLFLKMREAFESKEPGLFTPQVLKANIKKQAPILKSQKERLNAIILRNHIDCPYDIDKLTRNEASRYYDELKLRGYQ